MKTKLILLAALMLGGVAQTYARSDSNLLRQASALECLADDIPTSLRRSLAGHCIESEHQRFLNVAHSLQSATDRFLCQVREGEDARCLSGTLASVRRSFASVRSSASCVRLSSTTRSLICQFEDALASVRLGSFAHEHEDRFERGQDRDFDRHYEAPRRQPASDQEALLSALSRLLGSR